MSRGFSHPATSTLGSLTSTLTNPGPPTEDGAGEGGACACVLAFTLSPGWGPLSTSVGEMIAMGGGPSGGAGCLQEVGVGPAPGGPSCVAEGDKGGEGVAPAAFRAFSCLSFSSFLSFSASCLWRSLILFSSLTGYPAKKLSTSSSSDEFISSTTSRVLRGLDQGLSKGGGLPFLVVGFLLPGGGWGEK